MAGSYFVVILRILKESNLPRGWWGLTKNHMDSLERSSVRWFVVLLARSAETGYLLSGGQVARRVHDGTFRLAGDGDYKINERSHVALV